MGLGHVAGVPAPGLDWVGLVLLLSLAFLAGNLALQYGAARLQASATSLIKALAEAGDHVIHLHINSPGGDVFEARAMAAAMVAHSKPVIAHIDGVAASAATYLALAASEVRMSDGGLFMVHNSWTMAMGDRTELRSTADLLEKIDGTIAADYRRKTGASAEQVANWMNAETWFTAQEALDNGFVDRMKKTGKAKNTWNLAAFAKY